MPIKSNIFGVIALSLAIGTGPAAAFGTVAGASNPAQSTDHLSLPGGTPDDPIILAQAGGPDFYVVAGLSSGDTLNIRAGAGTGHRVVARAPNGVVLRNLGCKMHGGSRWCHVATRDGSHKGWVNATYLRESGGGSSNYPGAPAAPEVPEVAVRSSGEIEVRWRSGCTMLYTSNGKRIQAGSSCTKDQRQRSNAAVKAHRAEQGSGGDHSSSSAGGKMHMQGYGSVTLGGPLNGQVFTSNPSHGYAVILSATSDGFTCTGHLDKLPRRNQSESAPIHCTNGLHGSTILRNNGGGRYLLTFSAGGKGGLVNFR